MISVGIDIGSYSVKIAEAEMTSKGYVLRRFENFPLSIDPNKDHEIEVLDILRNLAQEYDQSTTRFVLAVDQKHVSFRRRLFPFKERHKILKSLPFELEDDIPLSQNLAVFDAKVTRYIGGSSDVIAVACPNEVIQQKIQLSEDCRFNLEILSIEGIALANLFENWQDPPPSIENIQPPEDEDLSDTELAGDDIPNPAEVLLSIGHQSSSLLIIKDKYLLEVRTFDWGGHYIAHALAKKYSMQSTEATRELETKSFILLNADGATTDQINFSNIVKEEIDSFAHDLQLTLLEIKSVYNLNFVSGFVTGGLSRMKNLGPYLTQKTEIPFKRLDVLESNPNNQAQRNEGDGVIAGLALGLAIEGLKKPKNPPINLLKGDFAKQSQSMKIFMDKWGHTLQVAAAMFVLFLIFGIMRESMTVDMVDKADEVLAQQAVEIIPDVKKTTRASTRKIKNYINKQKLIEKNIKVFKDLQKQNSALDVLNQISAVVPDKNLDINIKKFVVKNRNVIVEGEIKNKNSLAALKKAMETIATAGQVSTLQSNIKAQSGWSTFGFSFNVNRLTGSGN